MRGAEAGCLIPRDVDLLRQLLRPFPSMIAVDGGLCALFMQHRGRWNLIDCNLRIGAGTAMASAAGFQLVRAFWANLCGQPVPDEWLQAAPTVKPVLRVYQEVVVR